MVSPFFSTSKLPKMNFPRFEGENPRLWKSRFENYFDMYAVETHMWVKVATMHFEGPAARWLQSAERRLSTASWNDLCHWDHDRFGRDQHEALIANFSILSSRPPSKSILTNSVSWSTSCSINTRRIHFITPCASYGLREEIKSFILV